VTKVRVFIVDDHALVRAGLRTLIESTTDLEWVGEAPDAATTLAGVAATGAEVLVLDLELPGQNGLELLPRLPRSLRVLVLTSHSSETWAFAALRAGALGFVTKVSPPATVLTAIRAVAVGASFLEAALAQKLAHAARLPLDRVPPELQLSPREFEVFRLIGRALTNERIAEQLELSEKTVKAHVSTVLSKLGVSDRTEAAVMAWKLRVVRDDDMP